MWQIVLLAMASPARRAVVAYTDNGPILEYAFGDFACGIDVPTASAHVVAALSLISRTTPGLTFTPGPNGLEFVATDCASCNVWGYTSVNNTINLGWCATNLHAIVHEILHKLGFEHEQFHPNAADYVTINTSAMTAEAVVQWDSEPNPIYLSPFDICSVMMYSVEAEPAVTLTPLGAAALSSCSDAILSASDIVALRAAYPSDTKSSTQPASALAVVIAAGLIAVVALVVLGHTP